MQLELAFLYLSIWLFMLWWGSVALQATGMERSTAHFQALSALSGTGFTTKDAESVVNHSTRRWIVTWLMFFGNAGFITVLILIVVSMQWTWANMSPLRIAVITFFIILSALFIWLGMMDRVTDAIVKFLRKRKLFKHEVTDWELVYREGEYGIFRIAIHQAISDEEASIGKSPFWKPTINLLAIERDTEVVPFPQKDTKVTAGDNLLCYGNVTEIMQMARKN